MAKGLTRGLVPWLAAVFPLLIGLSLTLWGSQAAWRDAQQAAQTRFNQGSQDLYDDLRTRLMRPRYGLGGLRGNFASTGQILDVAQFRRSVLSRNMPLEFPGVLGFGFIQPVQRRDLDTFVAQMKLAYGGDFSVSHDVGAERLYLVRSVEPLERNRPALGMEVAFEPVRQQALNRALAAGALVLSGPIQLPQSKPNSLGTLYLLPIFDDSPRSPNATRSPLGFVYAAVDYQQLLADFDHSNHAWLDASLTDLGQPSAQRLYDSAGASDAKTRARPAFHTQYDFELGGRKLQLQVSSTPLFDGMAQDASAFYLGLFGSILSLALAALGWSLAAGRARAQSLAHAMTVELERLAMVAKLTTNAVSVLDPHGVIRWINPAFQRLTGYTPSEALGRKPGRLLNPDHLKSGETSRLGQCLRSGMAFHGELSNRGKNGRRYLVAAEVQPFYDARGTLQGFIAINTDITEQRKVAQELRDSRAFLKRTGSIAGVGGWQMTLDSRHIEWSPQTRRIHEVADSFEPTLENTLAFYPEPGRSSLTETIRRSLQTGDGWDLELPFVTFLGESLWVRVVGTIEYVDERPWRLLGAVQDITQRKQAQLALAQSKELLQVTLQSIGDAVLTTDLDGKVSWLNPVAEAMSGWSVDEATGQPVTRVLQRLSPESRRPLEDPVLACLREQRMVGPLRHTLLRSRQGTEYAIADSASPIRDSGGALVGAVMVFRDVTEAQRQTQELLHRAAKLDALTGLPNRLGLEQRIRALLHRGDKALVPGALLFVDLDHFKIVNDTGGHQAGDQVLIQVAALLKQAVSPQDCVARLGSDEFAILLDDCAPDQASGHARAICSLIDKHRFLVDGHRFRVGASIGAVPIDQRWQNSYELIQAADISCYAAKEAGRNRYHAWVENDAALRARLAQSAWGPRIEAALDEHRFELYAQRIAPLQTRPRHLPEALHCELLLRMRDGDGKLVMPSSFIPAAEHYQLASRIDRWVLQEAFAQLSRAASSQVRLGLIAINLSGQSIGDRSFHAYMRRLIERATFDVSVLCLEITETAAITHLNDATAFLQEMRKLGIQVALDDFGTGASSFGYLKRLTVDLLKIDGQFIRGLISDPVDAVSVASFCGVAKVLGIRTVAEFVDHEALLTAVRDLGVDFAQGYLLHVPEPLQHLLDEQPLELSSG